MSEPLPSITAGAALSDLDPLIITAPALLHYQTLNRTFKGTLDGLIFESRDGGATWQTIANFGSHCSIQALFERRDKIHAQVGVQANSFLLASADARLWRTVS